MISRVLCGIALGCFMMMKRWIIFMGILFFSTYTYSAEDISWRELVESMYQNNSEVRAAENTLRASEFGQRAAYNNYLPQIAGNVGYSKTDGPTVTALRDEYTASLTLSQNIFAGLKDQATVDKASATLDLNQAKLMEVVARVSYNLKVAYSDLLYAQRSLRLQQEIINRRKNNLRLVELRFESGRENRGSVLLSKAYFNQAQYDEFQAQNGIHVASAQLARVIGRDEEAEFQLREDMPLVGLDSQPNFRQLAQANPSYNQSIANVAGAQASLKEARAGWFPTLGVNASAGSFGSEWFPERDRWSLGVSLSFPLFNGGRDYYGTQNASAALVSARSSLEDTNRQIVATLKQAYVSYKEAQMKLTVDTSFREAAAKRAEIARVKYQNGLMTFEDWDIIESDLIAREKSVLQSQRDRARAEANWNQVLGKGVSYE